MRMILKIIGFLLIMSPVWGVPRSFDYVLSQVQSESKGLKIASLNVDVAVASLDLQRAQMFPRVTITGQSALSDAPGARLLSKLGQRSIAYSDMTPSQFNDPGLEWMHSGAVALLVPVDSFGRQEILVSLNQVMIVESGLQREQVHRDIRLSVGKWYGTWLIQRDYADNLEKLRKQLRSEMSGYQFRNAENPVGYSGWLAYQVLDVAIETRLLAARQAQDICRNQISAAGFSEENWEPESVSINGFIEKNFAAPAVFHAPIEVVLASANMKRSDYFAQFSEIGLAPQLSGFAVQSVNGGERDWGTGYQIGAFFSWEVLDARQTHDVARAQYKADMSRLSLAEQQVSLGHYFDALQGNLTASRQTILSLELSRKWMTQQASTAKTLYKTGSSPVVNWIEVLHQTALLLDQLLAARTNGLQASVELQRFNP